MRLALGDRLVDLDNGRISTGGELRAMELRILRHLARKPGTVVDAKELLAEVWGYAPRVRTNTVYATLHRLRASIEPDPSRPRHVVTVPGVGVKLDNARPVSSHPTNVGVPRDRRVGRTDELAAIDAQLDAGARLVSIVGPSGIGKSRLAAEWVSGAAERFPRGRWRVDAAGAGADLPGRVARVLGLPIASLGSTFADEGLAIVLDDLPTDEPAVVEAIGGWLDAGRVVVVVTAHDGVAIGGERIVRLGPLPEADAIALLVDRIRAGDPTFRPDDHADALRGLAEVVDRFPLGLEMAAAHAATVGLAAARESVATRVVGTGRRDVPIHHRSLEAMIACTWDRLPDEARAAAAGLAAFHRSFTLDQAAHVLGPGAPERVAGLVRRGLVTPVDGGFRLFDSVLAYVRRDGIDPDAMARVVAWHRTTAAVVVRDGLPTDVGPLDPAGLDQWAHASRWVLDTGHDALEVVVYAAIAALAAERHLLAERLAEGLAAVEHRLDPIPREWLAASLALARLRWRRGDDTDPVAVASAATDRLVALGLPALAIHHALSLAIHLVNLGRGPEARATLARARALLAATTGAPRRVLATLALRERTVGVALAGGEPAAVPLARDAIRLAEELGLDRVQPLLHLTATLLELERFEDAEVTLRRANPLVRSPRHRAEIFGMRAMLVAGAGDPEALVWIDLSGRELEDPSDPMVAWFRIRRGHIRRALGDLRGAWDDVEATTTHRLFADPRVRLAVAHLRTTLVAETDPAEALRLLDALRAEAIDRGLPRLARHADEVAVDVLLAERRYDEVPERLSELGRAWCVRAAVEVGWGTGGYDLASSALAAAEAHGEGPPYLAHARAMVDTALRGAPDRPPGRAAALQPWSAVYLGRIAWCRGRVDQVGAAIAGIRPTTASMRSALDDLRRRTGAAPEPAR